MSKGGDRRVRVVPRSPVAVDDLGARLIRSSPHEVEVAADRRTGAVAGERASEHLAEVPGLGDRQVLDQAEEIGPGRGQRATSVILADSFELPEHRLSHVAQVTVQVLLRELIDHGNEPLRARALRGRRALPAIFTDACQPVRLSPVAG